LLLSPTAMLLSPVNITIPSTITIVTIVVVIVMIIGRRGVKWNIISWEGHHTYANYATSAAATARVKEVVVDA
jgi:predicted transglutaminase-like protease